MLVTSAVHFKQYILDALCATMRYSYVAWNFFLREWILTHDHLAQVLFKPQVMEPNTRWRVGTEHIITWLSRRREGEEGLIIVAGRTNHGITHAMEDL